LTGEDPRHEHLAALSWTVADAPADGAILPDCVALSCSADGSVLPLMFVGKEVGCVVMPISTAKLLVGREEDAVSPDLSRFNEAAAACSEEFFLAHADLPNLRALSVTIGAGTGPYFESAISEAIESALPQPLADDGNHPVPPDEVPLVTEGDQQFGYHVQCFDFGDDELAKRIANVLSPLIGRLSAALPLNRLDGITIAVDYWEALRRLDRGLGLPPIHVEGPSDVGIIGSAHVVVRDGEAKGRVILSVLTADYLLRDDEVAVGLALQVVVHQLAVVAMMELIERAVPNGLLSAVIEDRFQAGLFQQVADALSGYVGARISGPFGEGETLGAYYRTNLSNALAHMKAVSAQERAAFRDYSNADQLLAVVMPTVGPALYHAAVLIGHCEATDEPIADAEGNLTAILSELNLSYWLADYGMHLEAFWGRLGGWDSLEEFLAFNRHVERLLWAVAIFPWESPEGVRVDVLLLPEVDPQEI
jgi:hypothetical protein